MKQVAYKHIYSYLTWLTAEGTFPNMMNAINCSFISIL